ncbi:hypothetical protein SCLCIDRAFT_546353 [Scleroderma citrinum Foug A]|uniref:Uncharacterized protein n=1 Tax=Scleroderma citrinum Foug A TaxID=1036808 RepID=A0A0C3D958_9AGAM|nr:hypothetical protein SCLCIDRAFT_546353 [Scleroderma citrinum Foug A]
MISTFIPVSVLMHHIYQIQDIAALIMSQYAYRIYNTQPFSSQLGDASMMLTYCDPASAPHNSANTYNDPLSSQPLPIDGQYHLPPPPPPPATTYACRLALGCTSPLEATTTSVRRHLRMHGYTYKDRQRAPCPWAGCSQEMRWTNVARHVIEIHLEVRVR